MGDRERLERIVAVLQRAEKALQPEEVDEPEEKPKEDDKAAAALSSYMRRVAALSLVNTPQLTGSASERGGVKLSGNPLDLIDTLDRAALLDLDIELRRGGGLVQGEWVRLAMSRTDGVKLSVLGAPDWINDLRASLENELDRGAPWWWWLRAWPGFLLYLAIISAAALLLALVAGRAESGWEGGFGVVVALAVPTFGIAFGIHELVKKVLPGFEITVPGGRGSGDRALGIIGVIALSAIGILVSLLD